MREVIIRAIQEKRALRVVRDGYVRLVCPFRVGWSAKGEYNVVYYQFGGYSRSGLQADGSRANWRCDRVHSLSAAEIIDEPWHEPDAAGVERGPCVVRAEAEVAGYYLE